MYIIQEIQTNNGQSALLPPITKEDKLGAESAFHSICAAAAISSVMVHTAIVYDEHGNVAMSKYYEHIPEASNVAE